MENEKTALRLGVANAILILRKKFKSEKLKGTIVWEGFPDGSAARAALSGTITQLPKTFEWLLTCDELRDTIDEKVEVLAFEAASSAQSRLEGKRLTIGIAEIPLVSTELQGLLESALSGH